ncbi:MAG: acyl-CoA carboxylase subunit epsilon [Microbacteriaceae bacterium]
MSEPTQGTDFTIVGGNPTSAEIAAVTGVLSAVLEELAEENTRGKPPVVSAWQRTQRGLRSPLHPTSGAWRNFSG